jgi:16S rRNA (cytidine1402-2'-O)-methyltransferase
MLEVWGEERKLAVARELTKLYETVLSGTLGEITHKVASDSNQQKGEFVIVVDGALPVEQASLSEEQILMISELLNDLAVSRIAGIMSKVFGGKKKVWYQQVQTMKDDS